MENRLPLRICLGLFVAVLAAFFPVMNCDFVNWDDGAYVYNNSHVKTGLTRENIAWAWTSFEASNWHPLTWMSHQLDCQLWDLRPRPHHVINLGWHIASTLALYLVLRRMTGEDWRPALVAALFGLHPLHVESVAWVSERKDVTSTFFAILTLGMYTLYAAQPSLGRYLAVLAPFVIGLLFKPMLVTWPFVLLLLDYWPLRRTPSPSEPRTPRSGVSGTTDDRLLRCAACAARTMQFAPASWTRLVLEKVPLLILAAASSAVTMHAQVVAMKPSEHLALGYRLANAVVTYAAYLRKMVWPTDLAAFYRHLGTRLPMPPVIVSGVVLVFLSLGVLLGYRRRPALLVGWLWYLGTLVPVLGIVQVGGQSMADRYTYIPLIGIFLALAWSLPPLPATRPAIRATVGVAVCGVLLICAALTYRQTQVWRGSEELWGSSVRADANPVSQCFYAGALYGTAGDLYGEAQELSRKGRTADAQRRIAEAKARIAEAERQCRIASRMDPPFAIAYVQLGDYQIYRCDLEAALATFTEAVARDPRSAGLHDCLGRVLAYMGRIEEAKEKFREACELVSGSGARFFDLGTALVLLGNYEEAQRQWEKGRQQEPDFSEQMRKYAESFLGHVDARRRCPAAAVFHAQEACWSSPTPQPEFYQTLAEAYAAVGQPVAASLAAERALALAQTQARRELISTLRQLAHSYESLARQKEARAYAFILSAPTSGTLPGVIGAFGILEADWAERRFSGALPADRRRANNR